MDWTLIIVAVLGVLTALITAIGAPLVASKLTTAQREKLDYWMRIFIAAAETEVKGEKMGDARKQWVMEKLRGMGLKFDTNTVSAAIDGVCRELTAALVINTDK